MKLKLLIVGLAFSLFGSQLYPCSCQPFTVDFFQNLNQNTPVAMLRIDSLWSVQDSSTFAKSPFARLIVIKNYNSKAKVGDTLVYEGQDGVNCNWGYDSTWTGDTIIGILGDGAIKFWEQTHCGTPAIRIKNGRFNGMSIQDIEAAVNQKLTSIEEYSGLDLIRINPNPVGSKLVLNLPSSRSVSVEIFTITGKAVRVEDDLRGVSEIGLEELPSGLYLVQLRDGLNTRTLRMVKE